MRKRRSHLGPLFGSLVPFIFADQQSSLLHISILANQLSVYGEFICQNRNIYGYICHISLGNLPSIKYWPGSRTLIWLVEKWWSIPHLARRPSNPYPIHLKHHCATSVCRFFTCLCICVKCIYRQEKSPTEREM